MSANFLFQAGPERAIDVLWEEGDRTFSRGTLAGTDGSVFIVRPKAQTPCPVTLARLAHEFGLRDRLHASWAAQPVALHTAQGSAELLVTDHGGEPLSRLIGAPLSIAGFLDLAIGIASSVGRLHQSGLVHKDLKPGHILVAASRKQAWLTGFGNASAAARDTATVETSAADCAPHEIVGTLAYMSPEQTGRMNRAVDTRSDLYAIGVTFYQMLTGALPFQAAEPRDWVHCHLARTPVPPAERVSAIPPVLSAMVMKLLAKSPDERYQTAAGLKADLERCQGAWLGAGAMEPFALGQHDLSDDLVFPQRLYGRERETTALLDAWRRVAATGVSELVLVSGRSGAGKTSVVQQAIGDGRSMVAAGKAEARDEMIPYATLAQALERLLQQRLAADGGGESSWRDALAQALGADGALLAPLVPEIGRLLGPYPPVCELRPGEAERRMQDALEALIDVLARRCAPLAIFLDDVQWMDAATVALVQRLVAGKPHGSVLIVCAYRESEVAADHALLACAASLREAGHGVLGLHLGDLDAVSVGQLLADTLHCSAQDSVPLARLVKERTAGNPFFVIQFLTELADEALLRLDYGVGRWTWDLAQIRAKGLTDNVAELMLSRIGRLSAPARQALLLLACLGNDTSLANLRRAWTDPDTTLEACLWEAIRAGLIVRSGGAMRFRHDRIQEAVYRLLQDADRRALHLRIGRRLAATVPAEALDDQIFVIVEQFNQAGTLVTEPGEKERVAELNLSAALRSKAVSAYATAQRFLQIAQQMLDDEARERRSELAFALAQHTAECDFHTGQLASAERRLACLADQAADICQLAVVTQLRLDLLLTVGRREEAVGVGLRYLGRAGVPWPRWPSDEMVGDERAALDRQLAELPPGTMLADRPMREPEMLGTMRVLVALVQPAWYSDDNLRKLVIYRMANLLLRHGHSDEAALVYAWVSMLLVPEPGGMEQARMFGRVALYLAERRGNDRFAARAFQVMGGNVLHWSEPLHVARSVVERALRMTRATHNDTYAAYIHSNRATHALAQGQNLGQVQAAMEHGSIETWGGRYALVKDRIEPRMQLVRTLRGETPVFGHFDADDFDEAAFEAYLQGDVGRQLAACWYWIRKLQARYLAGDYASAVACARQAEALLWTSPAYLEQAEYHFHAALALASAAEHDAGTDRTGRLAALAGHHRQLLAWAADCPATFACRAALVAAEIARVEGRDVDAMRGYEAAIVLARDHDFVHVRAIANETAARFYLARGIGRASRGYLLEARHCYGHWGADAKVWQLDALYPEIAEDARPSRPTGTIDAPLQQLDMATVIAVSQAVAGETSLARLVEMLVRTAIEQAGASRGVLILPADDGYRVVAEAHVERSEIRLDLAPRTPGPEDVPLSLVCQVIQRYEHAVIDDAAAPSVTATDVYFRQRRARSVLCLPLLNQAKLVGVLYLENELAPRVFVPARTEVLKLLAFQAATALENTRLYAERRQADDALHAAQAELAHVSRVVTMNALASSIAHEVSQPLVAVVANANAASRWLNREVPDLAEVGDALTAIAGQARRASDVIAGMRAMLRKTSGARVRLDINAVITQTLVLIEGEALRHRCRIDSGLGAGLPEVMGDRVQLQQVILNLVMNGLEAMGSVEAAAEPEAGETGRRLSVRTRQGPEGVVVEVVDLGTGLDDEAMQRLFAPFYTTKAEGLGMGLSICLSIIEGHGGRLWVTPGQPRGTVFSFSLPRG